MNITHDNDWEDSFNDFIDELESAEQPACNIDNPEGCDSCGS